MIKYLYILYKKIADRVAPESEENLASFPLINYEISIGDNAMRKIEYKKGQKINRLTFIKEIGPYVEPSGRKRRMGLFKCDCGNYFEGKLSLVRCQKTKSCGCYRREVTTKRATTHNLKNHLLYTVWCGMKDRCYRDGNAEYHRYGGRGIKVCDEWQEFEPFYNWAIKNGWGINLTIDRINNDGCYDPFNCRFVTQKENNRNSSATKLNTQTVEEIRERYNDGKNGFTQKELASYYGVTQGHIGKIIRNEAWT